MTMVISTSPANRYVTSVNCTCCVTMLNQKTKLAESATSILRKKRSGRHCLFRHCSGLVCPRKLMKRRRNRQHCLRLRVSQEAISDYWKTCDKSIRDENDIDDVKTHQENADRTKEQIIKEMHEHGKGEILKKNDKYMAEKIPLKRNTNEKDVKLESEHKSPCICADNPCNNYDISPLSLRIVETKYEENENTKKFNNFINICDTDTRILPKHMNESTPNVLQKKNSLRKTSISDFGKTINAGDHVNSIFYNDIRKKYASTIKTKSSKNYLEMEKTIELSPKSEMAATGKINPYQESNVDRHENNFLDNTRMYSLKQKHNSKHPINKSVTKLQKKFAYRNTDNSRIRKNIYPVSSYKNTMYQRKQPELPCQNCYYDTKRRNCDSQWKSNKKQSLSHLHPYPSTQPRHDISRNLQSQKSNYQCECLKTKKKFDSVINRKFLLSHDVDSLKSKPQAEKPTLHFIFKNRRSNRSRNSTNSLYSSSIISTATGERPIHDNLNTHQRSTYKSSRYTMPSNDRYKNNKNSTEIDSTCLLSSSSSLSSSRRCHSWTILPQNSIYHKQQEPISSSSCTNIHRWKRRYPANEERTSTYLSSTSCSLSSLSTFRDYYLDETEKETRQIEKSWRKPKFRPQKKKIIYTDERHVRWNVKNTY